MKYLKFEIDLRYKNSKVIKATDPIINWICNPKLIDKVMKLAGMKVNIHLISIKLINSIPLTDNLFNCFCKTDRKYIISSLEKGETPCIIMSETLTKRMIHFVRIYARLERWYLPFEDWSNHLLLLETMYDRLYSGNNIWPQIYAYVMEQ